jgi:predicted MFS family arabinose efflux permease
MICQIFSTSAVSLFSFGAFIAPLEQEFHWTRAQVSFAAAIISYALIFANFIQGFLLDRFGPRRLLLTTVPLFSLVIASFYFLPANLPLFYLLWVVAIFCGPGNFATTHAKLDAAWFDRNLGIAVGITAAGIGIAGVVLPILAQTLIAQFGWRGAYVGLAVVALIVVYPICLGLIYDKPSDKGLTIPGSAGSSNPVFGDTFREAVRRKAYILMAVAFLLLGFVSSAILVHQIPMLIDSGWTPQRAALVASVFGIAMICARLVVGLTLDRFFAPYVLIACIVAAIVALTIYAAGLRDNIAFLCALLIGTIVGAEFDFLGYALRRYFGTRAYGKLYGSIYAIFSLGGGIGVAALGISRTAFGSYAYGLWIADACAVVALLLVAQLGAYTYQPQARS